MCECNCVSAEPRPLLQDASSGIGESLGGGGMKHPRRCQPSLCAESCDSHPGISLAAAAKAREGRDKALRSQTRSRLLAQRQAQQHSTPRQPAPGGAGESAAVLSPPDPAAVPTERGSAAAQGSGDSQAWPARQGTPRCCPVLQPGCADISRCEHLSRCDAGSLQLVPAPLGCLCLGYHQTCLERGRRSP